MSYGNPNWRRKRSGDGYVPTEKAGKIYWADIMGSTPDGVLLQLQGHTRAFWFPKNYIIMSLDGENYDVKCWIPSWLIAKVH